MRPVCSVVGEMRTNISDLHFVDKKPDYYRIAIDVDLRDAEHLHTVLTALDAETDVAGVARKRDRSRKP